MIRGIYPKLFLWFCFASAVMSGSAFVITAAIHSQSLGPRWMTGTLDLYARSAVELYFHGGVTALTEYLDEMNRSSRIEATLLDANSRNITGRRVPPEAENLLAEARAAGESRFRTGIHWTGASIVPTTQGNYVLVGLVRPYAGLWNWREARTPLLRLIAALVSGALLCLILARHIAAPVRTLQTAARRIADGELSVRAFPAICPRNDELADLAHDFDRMADRIQSLVRKQQELLGDISHELRSPLTRLSVSLELMRRGEADGVERMQMDLDRLDDLIGQILTLTRLEASGDRPTSALVNLRHIIQSVVEDAAIEGRSDEKSVVITAAEDCWMTADAALLRSCIENVVRNAIRYTIPRSEVSICLSMDCEDRSRPARIVVSDRGDGVPQSALPRLFEPFYRVSKARDHKSGGTGLGLSIAQRVTTLYGGSIAARNREGGGLEVEIRLPARDFWPAYPGDPGPNKFQPLGVCRSFREGKGDASRDARRS
jgi:two-component system sensor histidine kinase CpxA